MTALELQDRVAALATKAKSQAKANRARAPEFAEFVDAMRAAFGDVKVRFVRWPDGSEQGRPFGAEATSAALQRPEPPRARRSDPQTSKAAATSVREFAGEHHRRILAALKRGMTCHELAAATGLDHVAVARRLSELRSAGQVVETGKTRAGGVGGRQCVVWERA